MTNPKPRESSIHLAAQCWCDDETSMIEMDTRLAMAFAKRYDALEQRLVEHEAEVEKARDEVEQSMNVDYWGEKFKDQAKELTRERKVTQVLEAAIESVLYGRLGGYITTCAIGGGEDQGQVLLDKLSEALAEAAKLRNDTRRSNEV